MYVDKPTRGPRLMPAIARVNRMFRDTRADWSSTTYLGLAHELKPALATYTESDTSARRRSTRSRRSE